MSLLVLSLLFGVGEPKADRPDKAPPKGAGLALPDATRSLVSEMLNDVWIAPATKAKKLGNAILQKARKQDANRADVQYAYGLALIRLGDRTAAETNFESILDKDPSQPRVALALVHLHLDSERWSQAFGLLDKLLEAHPHDPDAIRTLATVTTFFQNRTPPKMKRNEIEALEQAGQKAFNDKDRAIYQSAVQETEAYLRDLPAIREDLLKPVEELSKQSQKYASEAEERDRNLLPLRADHDRAIAEIDRTKANGTADLANIDRQIERARQRGDAGTAAALQTERQAALAQIDARVRVAELRLQEVQQRIEVELMKIQRLLAQAQAAQIEASQATSQIDHFLSLPPARWNPLDERKKLLAGESLGLVRKPKEEKPPAEVPTEITLEDRARRMLSLADSSRMSGKLEMARQYYQKVIGDFPGTIASEDAAWQLDQMKEETSREEKESPSPGKKRPRGKKVPERDSSKGRDPGDSSTSEERQRDS